MAVETDGTVRIKGDTGAGLAVRVIADGDRLRLVSGNELVGDWDLESIGITVLSDGFAIRAEGEEIILRADDDTALAEEIGVAAAAPRMARRLAASHNPVPATPPPVDAEPISNVTAIGFALAGVMILSGGTFLRSSDVGSLSASGESTGGFWLAFVVAGLLMVVVAFVMSIGARFARLLALVAIGVVVVLFAVSVSATGADSRHVAAYGFIAGGMVVAVAVIAGGSARTP